MSASQIKLLLLDFDGTLADTRRANTRAYVQALREAGYTLTEATYETTYFGMRCNEFLSRFGIADPAERERIRLRKIALYPAFFDTVRLNRPLWEFCRQFRSRGGRVWIVSTGSRANIENVMAYLGIGIARREARTDGPAESVSEREGKNRSQEPATRPAPTKPDAPEGWVDGVLSGADVGRSKPAPDCFLRAMEIEGVTPGETLIFEDSAIGLEAARRSGAAFIKVEL